MKLSNGSTVSLVAAPCQMASLSSKPTPGTKLREWYSPNSRSYPKKPWKRPKNEKHGKIKRIRRYVPEE